MELAVFLILAVVCVASAANILIQRQPIYSALSLILTFVCLAGIYLQMQAEFIAVMQVVVYTGAIMVLFVFVIMLLNAREETARPPGGRMVRFLGIPLVVLLVAELGLIVVGSCSGETIAISDGVTGLVGNTQLIGRLLYTDYALPFELTSILLLVAIVGAILLAKKEL
jgi:NADH-quinone oxidoreductase subunit J